MPQKQQVHQVRKYQTHEAQTQRPDKSLNRPLLSHVGFAGGSEARALQLTLSQMEARDRLVYRFLQNRGVPMAYLMAGGYGERSWEVYARFLEWVLLERL